MTPGWERKRRAKAASWTVPMRVQRTLAATVTATASVVAWGGGANALLRGEGMWAFRALTRVHSSKI